MRARRGIPVATAGLQPPDRVLAGALAAALVVAAHHRVLALATLTPPMSAVAHGADAAQTLGVGLFTGVALAALFWMSRASRALALAAGLAASTAIAHLALDRVLRRQAHAALDGLLALPLHVGSTLGAGVILVACVVLGHWLSGRPRLRWALAPVMPAALVANWLVLSDDYHEVHACVAWAVMLLVAPALGRAIPRGRAAHALVPLCSLAGAAGLAVPPSNAHRLDLFRQPGPVGAWLLAGTSWKIPAPSAVLAPPAAAPWAPPASRPASPGGVPGPVVVVVTIDALRADVVLDPKNDERFPTLSMLKRTGTSFSSARSPGSQTSVSLSTMFAGKHFSQLRWRPYGVGSAHFLYPADDPTIRFPQHLTDAGVSTVLVAGLQFLAQDFGIARGFAREIVVVDSRRHARAGELVAPLLAALEDVPPEGAFLFTHLMEPHAPYDRGAVRTGPIFERYLSEVEAADRALSEIAKRLSRKDLQSRAYLIVSSDHGEAFGEHGTTKHTKTIYEELVRVPLLVRGPDVARRVVDEPVSLIDVGPTVLDLFGLPTPSDAMGESLVPFLRGEDPELTRPIIMEGRLRRALVLGRTKVIADQHRKVVEAFDLETDPGELHNTFEQLSPEGHEALARLHAFFERYEHREPGYVTPFKP